MPANRVLTERKPGLHQRPMDLRPGNVLIIEGIVEGFDVFRVECSQNVLLEGAFGAGVLLLGLDEV